ncbi:uncharacterized protein K460DRAFT_292460 [Cucurbitaria berberidis CBS 394.84]|uniref:MARVEL domain-containing protein n=1 Tax=Cucurbitaria berberidis CBS 394.84 TaxID=1168544 RepID=A0A9P4L544_9PLEO|nr:uncharacterized protein K460DRAFT_292460 [Cucurbitaria berberidis CBS 394.84]KAF1841598.1 hypothetical protein K460DRAFT_292460 [Cucurbitaria berberidis CBS 394.84]
MANPLVNFVIRGFQFLFAIVILGLSVSLIRHHHWGNLPATLGFAAFVAGVSILGAFVGIAATWVSMLDGAVGLIIDGVVAVINAAGGIAMAVKLNGVQCKVEGSDDNSLKMIENNMLNGGCLSKSICYWYTEPLKILSLCKVSQADTVFMFLTVFLLAVSAVFTFLRMRKGY